MRAAGIACSLVAVSAISLVAEAAPVVEHPACKPSWYDGARLERMLAVDARDAWFQRVSVRVPECEDLDSIELVVSSSTAADRRALSVADAPPEHRVRTIAMVLAAWPRPPELRRAATSTRSPDAIEPTIAARPDPPRAVPAHQLGLGLGAYLFPARSSALYGGALRYLTRVFDFARLLVGVSAALGRSQLELGAVDVARFTAQLGVGVCPLDRAVSVCVLAFAESGLGIVSGVGSGSVSGSSGRAWIFGGGVDLVVGYDLGDAFALEARVGARPTIRGVVGQGDRESAGVGGVGFAATLGVARLF